MAWIAGKRTYILAGITVTLSVLAMTEGWITSAQGVSGILFAAGLAALRAALVALQSQIDTKVNGGAK